MFAGLLLLVLLSGGIWAFSQYEARHREPGGTTAQGGRSPSLERWVAAGLITAEQAEAITRFEVERKRPVGERRLPIARSSKVPAVAEGLGYLGGVLAITGLVAVLSRSWPDLAVGGQLAIAGLAALAGIGGGSAVDESADPALARLRWALWTLGTASLGVLAWVVADHWAGLQSAQQVALVVSSAVALCSGVLWRGRLRPIQQFGALGASIAAVGFGVASMLNPGVAGIAVWLVAAAVLAWSWFGGMPTPSIGALAGTAGLLAGGFTMGASWQAWGMSLASSSALAVLLASGWRGLRGPRAAHLVGSWAGLIGLLISLPQTIGYLAGDGGLATAIVLFGAGAAVLALADGGRLAFPPAYEVLGAGLLLGAPAVLASQFEAVGLISGLVLAVAFLILATTPGRALLSAVGLLGLLAYTPSTVLHFFPGRSKGPVAILITGLLFVLGAVAIARRGGAIRHDVEAMNRERHQGGLAGHPS